MILGSCAICCLTGWRCAQGSAPGVRGIQAGPLRPRAHRLYQQELALQAAGALTLACECSTQILLLRLRIALLPDRLHEVPRHVAAHAQHASHFAHRQTLFRIYAGHRMLYGHETSIKVCRRATSSSGKTATCTRWCSTRRTRTGRPSSSSSSTRRCPRASTPRWCPRASRRSWRRACRRVLPLLLHCAWFLAVPCATFGTVAYHRSALKDLLRKDRLCSCVMLFAGANRVVMCGGSLAAAAVPFIGSLSRVLKCMVAIVSRQLEPCERCSELRCVRWGARGPVVTSTGFSRGRGRNRAVYIHLQSFPCRC